MLPRTILKALRVPPGRRIRLADYETDWDVLPELEALGKDGTEQAARAALARNLAELSDAQELLWADDRYALLVVLQAMDAAGKDGTIKHVMSGLNPQGCHVTSFKRPSEEELDHTFLWRCMKALPERGRIGIFNRSYYEEVLVVRVHETLLDAQKLPPGARGPRFWKARYEDINAFERHLVRNGTLVLKFFLHVSKSEQRKRFLERLEQPDKQWKFSLGDLKERAHWDEYQTAYAECLSATSTKEAPWYVIPADQKWMARACVAEVLTTTIRGLDLQFPTVSDADRRAFAAARRQLLAE